jgi:hypothetical protein
MKIIITEDQYNKLVEYKKSMDFGFELTEASVASILDLGKHVHLPQSFINDLSKRNPKMADIINTIVKEGPNKALDKWKKMVDNDKLKDVDFEDLLSISNWVDGSVTNKNPKDVKVPDFIIQLIKDLS